MFGRLKWQKYDIEIQNNVKAKLNLAKQNCHITITSSNSFQ